MTEPIKQKGSDNTTVQLLGTAKCA